MQRRKEESGMCTRFVVDDTVWAEVEKLVGWLDRSPLGVGDVFPAQQVLILRKGMTAAGSGDRKPDCAARERNGKGISGASAPELSVCMAHWGYPGYGGAREIVNARAETVQEKPSFRADFAYRRCVIPAKGFYEWSQKKEKFYFCGQQQSACQRPAILYLAGIYSNAPGRERVAILTTGANAAVRPVHDRMPLILSEEEIAGWVEKPGFAADLLRKEPPGLKREQEKNGYEQLSLF